MNTKIASAITIIVAVTLSTADITGSGHDFSQYSWAESEICKPCHTPHNANETVATPLWNHQLTTATYTLYAGLSDSSDIQQPGIMSRLCLSCHDGTVAVDSYATNIGNHYITGDALISTDLSNDHPIGIKWEHQGGNVSCFNCHDVTPGGDLFSSELPFYEDARIECMTCHEPHNKENIPGMLRISNTGSALCLHCHNPQ